jgi:hypothetical protein
MVSLFGGPLLLLMMLALLAFPALFFGIGVFLL